MKRPKYQGQLWGAGLMIVLVATGCGKDKGVCSGSEVSCAGECVNLATDPDNCGGCGIVCGANEVCSANSCVCAPTYTDCNGSCVDTDLDPNNCGGCGIVCGANEVCSVGSCALSCQTGLTDCNGSCVDTDLDPDNCGGCGIVCGANEVCSVGSCELSCQTGLTDCYGSCVDTDVDTDNCGGCGIVCDASEICSAGSCELSCQTGLTNCYGFCVDTDVDTNHCGGCGIVCTVDEVCISGNCDLSCQTGFTDCYGSCVDTDVDTNHCGGCGIVCGMNEVCSAGSCECQTGFTDCYGSCVDTDRDRSHCGGCGITCTASEACISGNCQVPTCSRSWTHTKAQGTDRTLEVRTLGQAVWVGTTSGLLRSPDGGQTWEAFTTEDGLGGDRVPAIVLDASAVYVGTNGGLSYSTDDGATWTNLTSVDGLAGDSVVAIEHATDGTFWIGTRTGLSHGILSTSTWTNFTSADGLSDNDIEDIAEAPDGSIWTAHTTIGIPGISVTSDGGATWTHPDIPNGLGPGSENPTQKIFFDSAGAVWVSTWADGLYRSTDMGVTWSYFAQSVYGTTSGGFVDDFYEDPAGAIWMGTQGSQPSGVSITPDFGATWLKRNNLCSTSILSVYGNGLGRVFAASYGCGLSWTNDQGVTWSDRSLVLGIPDNKITAVSRGPQGSIWIGTEQDWGAYSTDSGQTWTKVTWPNPVGYANHVVNFFYDDQASPPALWIGTAGGLYRTTDNGATFDSWTADKLDIVPSFYLVEITAIFVDHGVSSDTIWVATSSGQDDSPGGVSKSTDGGVTWTNYPRDNTQHGSNNSTDVFVDSTGTVWVTTTSGLRYSSDQGATWNTWIFNLNSTIPTSNLKSVLVEPDGTIWISGRAPGAGSPMFAAKSTDGGLSWTPYSATGGANSGARLHRDPIMGTIYVATEGDGVFWTSNQGQDWCSASTADGVGSSTVHDVTVGPLDELVLGTNSGLTIGMY